MHQHNFPCNITSMKTTNTSAQLLQFNVMDRYSIELPTPINHLKSLLNRKFHQSRHQRSQWVSKSTRHILNFILNLTILDRQQPARLENKILLWFLFVPTEQYERKVFRRWFGMEGTWNMTQYTNYLDSWLSLAFIKGRNEMVCTYHNTSILITVAWDKLSLSFSGSLRYIFIFYNWDSKDIIIVYDTGFDWWKTILDSCL